MTSLQEQHYYFELLESQLRFYSGTWIKAASTAKAEYLASPRLPLKCLGKELQTLSGKQRLYDDDVFCFLLAKAAAEYDEDWWNHIIANGINLSRGLSTFSNVQQLEIGQYLTENTSADIHALYHAMEKWGIYIPLASLVKFAKGGKIIPIEEYQQRYDLDFMASRKRNVHSHFDSETDPVRLRVVVRAGLPTHHTMSCFGYEITAHRTDLNYSPVTRTYVLEFPVYATDVLRGAAKWGNKEIAAYYLKSKPNQVDAVEDLFTHEEHSHAFFCAFVEGHVDIARMIAKTTDVTDGFQQFLTKGYTDLFKVDVSKEPEAFRYRFRQFIDWYRARDGKRKAMKD